MAPDCALSRFARYVFDSERSQVSAKEKKRGASAKLGRSFKFIKCSLPMRMVRLDQ